MPSSPFIPAAACPVTEQRNSYLPAFERVSVSVADCPGFKLGVFFPVQEGLAAAALATGFAQILKSWYATPMFFTLKVIVPAGINELFDSLKASSEGLPAVTVMMVTFGFAAGLLAAGPLSSAGVDWAPKAAIKPATTQIPRAGTVNRKGRRLICPRASSGDLMNDAG
jgi:hypothetical protein